MISLWWLLQGLLHLCFVHSEYKLIKKMVLLWIISAYLKLFQLIWRLSINIFLSLLDSDSLGFFVFPATSV